MDSDSTNEIVVALAAWSFPCVRSRHPCGVGDPTAAGVVLSTSNLIHVVAGSTPLKDHRGPWLHTLHSLTHPKRPGDYSGGRCCALKSRGVATNHLLVALRKAESGARLIIALVDTRGEARVADCCRVLSDKRVTDPPNSFRLTAACWGRLAACEACQHQYQQLQ